jgi:eukaryotic-like serine/threonine-protein kinase
MNNWLRIKELFHAALERGPAERAAFLNASCGDEPAVRAEVDRLLAAHGDAGEFIEQSPVALAGRVIGHYQIDRVVAAGGMGEVYVAHDLELGRTVAVKIALGGDADAHARLKREAQHASQLNHPNICTIHEIGAFDGQPFIAMEYVEGRRLADVIPPDGLSIEQVTHYGSQIASALAHAHRHGVIHRDLKSPNVMVTSDERIKVLDFGLARRHSVEDLKDLSESRASLTAQEPLAGTLSCMPPELLRGGTADARSDVWALGVLLYEMTTGKRPFDGATGFELSGAILHEPPAALPDRLPVSLKKIILRCLAKDPDKRYQQAEYVAADLESVVRRKRPAVSWRAIAAAAVVLVAVAVATFALVRRSAVATATVPPLTAGAPAIAVMNFENVSGADDLMWMSKGVPRMLVTGLAQTSGLHIVSSQYLDEAVRKLGGTTIDVVSSAEFADLARRSGAGAIVSGTIMKAGDEIRVDVQLHDLSSGRVLAAESGRGADVFAIADHLTTRIRAAAGFSDSAGVRRVADVSSSSLEAYRLYSEGVDACNNIRWADAFKLLEAAVAIDPGFAEAYLQLSVVAVSRGMLASRVEYLRKAEQYADRLSEQQRRFLELQLARGSGQPAKVIRLLDEFLADYPTVEDAYGVINSLYSPVLSGVFDPEKAISIGEMGVKVLPASGPIRNTYGYALLSAGRHEEALREFETYARLVPREPNPHDSIGEAYLLLGMPDKAVESYARARSIDPTFGSARNGQALALGVLGRYDEAIAVDPELVPEKAILLSRVGRYREAAQAIEVAGRRFRELGLDAFGPATLHLLAGNLSLERHDFAQAAREAASAERVFTQTANPRRATYMLVTHLLAGVASLRNGDLADARTRLEKQKQFYNPKFPPDLWLHKALEGEIALKSGDPRLAAIAFSEGELRQNRFHFDLYGIVLIVNHLTLRDGPARAANARGDLAGAIAIYRRLLSHGADAKWVSVLEPRYVLELARLLEKTGDTKNALREYERFLELWKRADPELPELDEARRAVTRLRT